MLKDLFNFLLILILIPVFLPLMMLIIIFIFITQGKPVFYTESRLGKNALPFLLYKFRTMKINKPGVLITDESPYFIMGGNFLRKTGLDELPQFINIIKGEMNLVGPRPIPESHQIYKNRGNYSRLRLKPGITGLAQIKGRNGISWKEKLSFDESYINNHSILNDIIIILKTPLALIYTKHNYKN